MPAQDLYKYEERRAEKREIKEITPMHAKERGAERGIPAESADRWNQFFFQPALPLVYVQRLLREITRANAQELLPRVNCPVRRARVDRARMNVEGVVCPLL